MLQKKIMGMTSLNPKYLPSNLAKAAGTKWIRTTYEAGCSEISAEFFGYLKQIRRAKPQDSIV